LNNHFLYKNYKVVILVISTILFSLGAYFHEINNFPLYRLIRGVIPISFLGLLLFYHGKKVYQPLIYFLFFYGLSSIATVWYEINSFAILSLIFNLLSFLVLIVSLLPKVDLKKLKGLFLIGFILMVLINGYLIFSLVKEIQDFSLSSLHFAFVVISTMALILSAFLVLLYNHTYSTKGSLYFSLFVFFIVFSEVFRALAYYNLAFGDIDVYIARILLIIAMCTLVQYSMVKKKNNEHLNTKYF